MHEPAIAAELINLVQAEATKSGYPAGSVTSIMVKIGALRAVVEESLRFAFDTLKADTPLKNAVLITETSAVHGLCKSCGADFHPQEPLFICANCGSGDLDIQQGNELDLVSLTLAAD